jgi:membrane protein implicated in regulation of membrane protease activity
MHIVAVAWIFVVVLMALVEATSTQGSWLGAVFTLLLYGVLPLAIVLYLMGTPARRRALKRAEAAPSAPQGDASGHSSGADVATEREKP